MFARADRVIFCEAVVQLRLGSLLVLVGAVPRNGPVAVLDGGVDNPRTEGDLTGLDIFLITLPLLDRAELGHVGGETLTLRPSAFSKEIS